MRCKNCGWDNPTENKLCERCSSPLEKVVTLSEESSRQPTEFSPHLRATIREINNDKYTVLDEGQEGKDCNNCGYNLSSKMNVCPQCGTPQNRFSRDENHQPNKDKSCPKCGSKVLIGTRFCPSCGQALRNSGTVNAWDNPQNGDFCSLRPIAWSRESTEYNPISFSGDRIVLNRSNTDPNNQSITSQEQALLTYDGKDWYIEDLSEQHSTMLRISRKTKLQSGDIISLGNRLFEFRD